MSMNCASRDIDHLVRDCNYRTFAVFCALTNATCRCHNGHVNDLVQKIGRAATVGSRLSPHRLHPRNLLDLHNRDIEHLVNELQLENLYGVLNSQELPLRHDRKNRRPRSKVLQLRACTVFCSLNHRHMSLHTTGV